MAVVEDDENRVRVEGAKGRGFLPTAANEMCQERHTLQWERERERERMGFRKINIWLVKKEKRKTK